ncbi:hypothetical protein BH10PLA1_BH10PLA1_02880 [soil metagenome]
MKSAAKRSAFSVALLYAAGGFAVAGAVLLAPPIHADGDPKLPAAKTSLSTPTFDLSVRYNSDTGKPELVATNTTDQPQTIQRLLRVRSTGPVNPGSRSMPQMKDAYTEPVTFTLAPRESQVLPIIVPAAKGNEIREVSIAVGDQSLVVPMMPVLALNK